MNSVKSVKSVLVAAAFGLSAASPVSALVLFADYSDSSVSGGIYQTAGGQLQSGPGGGAADITAIFKADVAAAFTYLQNSIKVAFNHVVTFKLRDFGMSGADGDSQITSEDVNSRPALTVPPPRPASTKFIIYSELSKGVGSAKKWETVPLSRRMMEESGRELTSSPVI